MSVFNTIDTTIGRTPIVKLNRMATPGKLNLSGELPVLESKQKVAAGLGLHMSHREMRTESLCSIESFLNHKKYSFGPPRVCFFFKCQAGRVNKASKMYP